MASKCWLVLVACLLWAHPAQATFSLVSGQHAYVAAGTTTLVLVLPNNPTTGNLVVIGFLWFDGTNASTGITSILDSAGNSYTLSTHSPSATNGVAAGAEYAAYLLSAPAGATKTVTITFTRTTGGGAGFIKEFHSSSGGVTFDTDIAGSGTTGSTVNTPTFSSPHTTNELYYASACVGDQITAVNSPWISSETLPTTGGDADGYILSDSGSQAINFTQNPAGPDWDSLILAFYDNGPGGASPHTLPLLGVR